MKNRITKKLVTFESRFSLGLSGQKWPAGDYTIETEEEPVEGAPVKTYRHLATTMVVRPDGGAVGATQYVTIDPDELAVALAADRLPESRADNEGMAI